MFRSTGSQIRIPKDNQLLKLLSHFGQQKGNYSIEEFITFLEFVPMMEAEQQRKITSEKLADFETSHSIFIEYLRTKLYQASPKTKETFTAVELEEILNEKHVDLKLVEELCGKSNNNQAMVNRVGAIIRSHSSRNNDHNEITKFMRDSLGNTR